MTAIVERENAAFAQSADSGRVWSSQLVGHGTAAATDRRHAVRARGVSPRLAHSRGYVGSGESITLAIGSAAEPVRTPDSGIGPARVVGARGARRPVIEHSAGRAVMVPSRARRRASSRVNGCARQTSRATTATCALVALGLFFGIVLLLSGAPGDSAASQGINSVTGPALTSMVTVRSGQSLEQIALEIAPNTATADVVREVAEINGLVDGHVYPGQTLVTPRYR